MAKRDIILELILAGGATKESLMEGAEVDAKGLASQFTYMRLMGNCPLMNPETKVFSIVSGEEWAQIKEDRAANSTAGSSLTPEERLEKAVKSQATAQKAADKKAELATKGDKKAKLRSKIANLTLDLRNIELEDAQIAVDGAAVEASE